MSMRAMIRDADRLWFGHHDDGRRRRDRDAAVLAFASLAANTANAGSDRRRTVLELPEEEQQRQQHLTSGQDDDDNDDSFLHASSRPCKEGACCAHRRRAALERTHEEVGRVPSCRYKNNNNNNTTINNTKSVCVIGGGASGLIALKELLNKKDRCFAVVTCYESSSNLGGVFANAYEGATMTSSNVLTAFGCYPMTEYMKDATTLDSGSTDAEQASARKDWTAKMWTCDEYCAYLQAFARRFNLEQHITFNTEVVRVRPIQHNEGTTAANKITWEVTTRSNVCSGDRNTTKSAETTATTTQVFDAVCVCSGLHQRPNIPSWCRRHRRAGDTTNNKRVKTNASLRILHSSEFCRGSDFTGQHVVVVGLGESGSDISLLVAQNHAASVKISVRASASGSGYVVSRYTNNTNNNKDDNNNREVGDLNTSRGFGRHEVWGPAEYDTFAHAVRKARAESNHEALKELARCFIGTDSFSDLDLMAIEWNAKYRNRPYDRFGTKNYSFLEAMHTYGAEIIGEITSLDDVPSETDTIILCTGYETSFPFLDDELAARAVNHRDRYQHMIDLELDGISLAFIGYSRPAFGAVPTLSELSARYWAQLLTGERNLPAEAVGERDIARTYEERLFRTDAGRIQSLVQYHRSMDSLAAQIGCMPPLDELKKNHFDLYQRVLHSALGGAQYRLVGEGWSDEAWDSGNYPLPEYTRQPRSAFRAKLDSGLFG